MQNILYFVKKHVKDIILLVLVIILVILTIYNTFFNYENNDFSVSNQLVYSELENPNVNNDNKDEVSNDFYVDVKGAVKNPGVYHVDRNAIINDVIKLAGGFNANAYHEGINLSKKISDEMVIIVYTKSEVKKFLENSNKDSTMKICQVPDYSICECINNKQSIVEIGTSNSQNNQDNNMGNIVNINTASKEELITLTGVGESKALAIIDYREKNGGFKNIEDIMNVSGIGEKAFEKIKDYITI